MRQIEHFIAGEFVASVNGKRFDLCTRQFIVLPLNN